MAKPMEVTDATFQDEFEKHSGLTIVDFWATWCGPCRTLGPMLEKVVGETNGAVELAKVDVDANPRVAATFQVQSIPAVFALRDRKIVDSFIGALPEREVRAFVERLGPSVSPADKLVALGTEDALRAALDLEPDHAGAVVGLAELLVGRGDTEEALALLARIPESAETRRVAALARMGGEAPLDAGGMEAKLDALLPRVKDDQAARQEFLDLLEVMGPEDPRTARYRRALTARLF